MSALHSPRVRIVTPAIGRVGETPNVLTRVEVDGELWPVIDYAVTGKHVDGWQTVTLTFHADVTVEHPGPDA